MIISTCASTVVGVAVSLGAGRVITTVPCVLPGVLVSGAGSFHVNVVPSGNALLFVMPSFACGVAPFGSVMLVVVACGVLTVIGTSTTSLVPSGYVTVTGTLKSPACVPSGIFALSLSAMVNVGFVAASFGKLGTVTLSVISCSFGFVPNVLVRCSVCG